MNPLRVGLSGCGPAGLAAVQHTRLHADCEIVALHDPDRTAAQRLAAASRIGFATDDFAALLGAGVDFVVLTGPLPDRLAQVELAAEQSVPCLLRAPVARDLATARAIAALAERHEVRLGVLVPDQSDPVLDQLRRMIAADWLGGVVAVQAVVGDDELLRTGAPAEPGDLFLLAISQQLHLAAWLTGRTTASVSAQVTRTFRPDLDDGAVATAILRGGITATFAASRLTRVRAFAVHGTDGGARIAGDRVWLNGQRPFHGHVFDYETPGLEQSWSRADLQLAIAGHTAGAEPIGRFARWLEDCDDFPCPIEQAIVDLEVADAMARAATSGAVVRL